MKPEKPAPHWIAGWNWFSARAEGSCSNKMLEQDKCSNKSHRVPARVIRTDYVVRTDVVRTDLRVAEVDWLVGRRKWGMSRRLWAAPGLLCLALALAACGEMGRFQTAAPSASPAKPNRTIAQTPAAETEHERILSSYGGDYDDPR